MDLLTPRRFLMKRRPIPLHWQVALTCGALAAVLVLAAFMSTETLVSSRFEAVAEIEAGHLARSFADMTSRTLEHRSTELQLLARSAALSVLSKPDDVRAELQRLVRIAPAYGVIAVADASGKVLAASSAAKLPESIADWPLFEDRKSTRLNSSHG